MLRPDLVQPSSSFVIIISTAIMASSTRSPSPMMSAPSEIRCRLRSSKLHGDEGDGEDQREWQSRRRCQAPAERKEAYGQDDGDGFDQGLDELANRLSDDLGLVGHRVESMPAGSRCIGAGALVSPSPKARTSPLSAWRWRGRWPAAVDAEHLVAGRCSLLDLGDVGQPVEAPVDPEVELGDGSPASTGAGDIDEHVLLGC